MSGGRKWILRQSNTKLKENKAPLYTCTATVVCSLNVDDNYPRLNTTPRWIVYGDESTVRSITKPVDNSPPTDIRRVRPPCPRTDIASLQEKLPRAGDAISGDGAFVVSRRRRRDEVSGRPSLSITAALAARRRRSQMQSDACPDESRPGQAEDVVDTASTSGRLSGQTPPALRPSALLILHYALSICRKCDGTRTGDRNVQLCARQYHKVAAYAGITPKNNQESKITSLHSREQLAKVMLLSP